MLSDELPEYVNYFIENEKIMPNSSNFFDGNDLELLKHEGETLTPRIFAVYDLRNSDINIF